MTLTNPRAFYGALREGDLLGPTLSPAEVNGCEALLAACAAWPLSHMAYGLGTTYHETAGTMEPIRERGGTEYFRRLYDVTGRDPERAKRMGNVHPGDGAKYSGRGFVQLTWHVNYTRAGKALGVALAANPDLAMVPDIAAKILEAGMRLGWFTGKRLVDYLPTAGPANLAQFTGARRIINGTDKASQVANYAMAFQAALQDGGWG
jgi:putative chitinase